MGNSYLFIVWAHFMRCRSSSLYLFSFFNLALYLREKTSLLTTKRNIAPSIPRTTHTQPEVPPPDASLKEAWVLLYIGVVSIMLRLSFQ